MPTPRSANPPERAAASEPEIFSQIPRGETLLREIAAAVNVTEAPEDAAYSLVIDLMSYCQREGIDWHEDVIGRARWNPTVPAADLRVELM